MIESIRTFIPQYDEITIEPSEIAFVPIGAGQTAAQIIMYTKAGKEFGVRNAFYEHYVEALAKEGIELPTINFDTSV